MHHTIKLIFRICFAAVIFIVTAALILTCLAKSNEIFRAEQNFVQAKKIHVQSTAKEQLVLLSNNQKPDQAAYIAIAQNGYIAKTSCAHYPEICIDDYNQQQTRQIHDADLIHAGNFYYIQKVNFTDSRTQQRQSLQYPNSQIRQFYAADISNLKYVVFGIGLFALAALYVSIRILRNLNKFIHK
ncbi:MULTISPECIES: hypothetical protein [Acinetobacter]|jgi:hypothetical protein|uniref:Uncharacterized protein n=2 Tax=Acinetobacter TaxID=469 RepID=A0A4Q7B273_9GAMM|nr:MULTISPECIES: hypothetical protein [Acinetobacter]MCW8037748.1 hypothetical protein [Acinetobacter entericus]QXW25292.1 hypothetical protein KXJ74_13355 [Acinetobacter johnsonii]RZG68740.1 hypothetical protein EXE25_03435 [Acinetobacter bouvetii]TCB75691.1 hypothetical protein E0H91_04670 [Acinetobacter sp. ANC 4177]